MATEIKVPEIGENVESGQVVNVLVSEGDAVEAEQPLFEVETEKAVVEIPCPESGTISELRVGSGDTIHVGDVVALLDAGEGTDDEPDDEKEEEEAKESKEKEGRKEAGKKEKKAKKDEKKEGKKEGEKPSKKKAKEDRPAARKESRKARETSGKDKQPEAPRKEGAESEGGEDRPPEDAGDHASRETREQPPVEPAAPASPMVRRVARELGLDIETVPGSGPGGRITEDDVKARARELIEGRRGGHGAPAGSVQETPSLPDFSTWGDVEREPLSKVRRLTAESTSTSWREIPHVTQFDEAEITHLGEFLKRHAAGVESEGGKLTVTAVLLKVVAAALERFPRFNSSCDMERQEIIYKRYFHLGLATATDRGLLVPVIRDVDQKSLTEVAVEITEAAGKARGKKIGADEMRGGTFTISNQGSIGGTGFTPIVYWPQVAILGVSRAATRPVWVDGAFQPRTILPLTLSYDHRVADGADAARFLRWIVDALEQPLTMFLK